jgi:hypothetical protein
MAAFLGLKPARLEWGLHEKIVERGADGFYHPEVVTLQWLTYERAQADKRAGNNELERQRERLTKAKADIVERRLAEIDGSLIGSTAIVETLRTVCTRIRSKMQAALPRLTRACFHAPNLVEALKRSRAEFDILLAELSALKDLGTTKFEVVKDESETIDRSATATGKRKRAG